MMKWISVNDEKPRCSRNKNSFGIAVLIWPRNPNPDCESDGFAYYGRRATGKPAFYKYGSEIHGVTHWMPLPDGPDK